MYIFDSSLKQNTVMKNSILTPETIISVHFNDEIKPTQIQYSTEINGKKVFLAEYGCDANDLADIKEMAMGESYYERAEGFHFHTYDVQNSSIATPFEDDMIPSNKAEA
jgi:hypothetical protein